MRNPVTSLADVSVKLINSIFLIESMRGNKFQSAPAFGAGFKMLERIFDADNFRTIHNRDDMTISTSVSLESLSEIKFVKTRNLCSAFGTYSCEPQASSSQKKNCYFSIGEEAWEKED